MPNLEKEFSRGAVHRFFHIDAREEQKVRERIERAGGLIRVFVHPDFEEYAEIKEIKARPEDVEKLKKEGAAFKRILSSASADLPPLFILESGGDVKEFQEKEAALPEMTKNDVYVIRTELDNPNPLPPEREDNYKWILQLSPSKRISDEERTRMWERLIAKFNELGVKKILIGGLELYVSERKDIDHRGCLGTTIKKLKESFEIEVSALTWPDGRKEIQTQK